MTAIKATAPRLRYPSPMRRQQAAGTTAVDSRGVNRRTVFRALAGAATTAAGSTLPSSVADAFDPGPDETKARYRETEDVKAFYRTNGYES